MRKLRFKNRNGVLYFGLGDKLKSSRMKYTNINKNILIGKFRKGLLDEELGIGTVEDVPTVNELLLEVISSKSKTLKHKTMLAYNITSKTKIIPYFAGKLVSEVRPIDIKKFHDTIIDKGLGKQTLVFARVLLKEVFSIAIINEWVTINPIKMVDMPKFKTIKKKQKPFTLDEIDLLLKNASPVLKNFLGISFFTGMRSGELLALTWDDVDFETDTISITKTIAEGIINDPKTASSERDIEILPNVKEFLKAQQLQTGLKNTYLFLSRANTHYSNNATIYIEFQRLLTKLKIAKRSLHNTRHTFASLMLNNGIDTLWVSNTLGHNNVEVTLRVYTHFMPRKEKMSIGFLEERYKKGAICT